MRLQTAAALVSFAAFAAAQTSTACQPLNGTCPSDDALGTTYNQTFGADSSLDSTYWTSLGEDPTFDSDGATFTITQEGDAPTVASAFYIFFGRVEVWMKAASGTGIISSIVLLSDDLDEVDWEIKGSNTSSVQTNYYGKGNTNESNAIYVPCSTPPQDGFHNYSTVWTSESLEWYYDGALVRTLMYADAVFEGKSSYPQTPSQLKIGNWAGGASESNYTRIWAGGDTNFDEGPFSMVVQSVKIVDAHANVSSYAYGDQSGSFQSIKLTPGLSAANKAFHAPPPLTLAQRWASYSSTTKIGIIVGIAVAFFLIAVLIAFCCVKQRRVGRREKAAADAEYNKERSEVSGYQQALRRGDFVKSGHFSTYQQIPG